MRVWYSDLEAHSAQMHELDSNAVKLIMHQVHHEMKFNIEQPLYISNKYISLTFMWSAR